MTIGSGIAIFGAWVAVAAIAWKDPSLGIVAMTLAIAYTVIFMIKAVGGWE